MDRTTTNTNPLGLSRPESSKQVLHFPQNFETGGTPSDAV